MKGLLYQLKRTGKDPFCIMSFLLPVIVALALHFTGSIDLSSLGEFQFGAVAHSIPPETENWLEQYASVTFYRTRRDLIEAIVDPSTNLIGIEMNGKDITTILSGDELALWQQTAQTLPALYRLRETTAQTRIEIRDRPDILAGYQHIFVAVTLIIALFMGCTFNAMNIISEKEDGVALVHDILPMTPSQYVTQKIAVGFLFACLSALLAAAICMHLSLAAAMLMLPLAALSALVAALTGLFIGRACGDLMEGVIFIKLAMLAFIAVPLLYHLIGSGNSLISTFCYLVPSTAAFEGIMALSGENLAAVFRALGVLLAHSALLTLLCRFRIAQGREKRM